MEQKLFHHFPYMICIDTVNQTNKDKRPILTISGRDTHGKLFIILRAFLPNEKAWVFCWIFLLVVPTLFSSYVLSQVKAIITDDCPQEFIQIDNARKTIFKNVLCIQCGFHQVKMGRAVHVMKKNCFPEKFGSLYDNVCNHLKRWTYSWMKSSCETRENVMASKLILKKFLNSKQIKSTLGSPFIDSVQNFFTKRIKPHESNYCFYLRLNLRHFYTNSIIEGINCGLKYNTAPVGPSTKILSQLPRFKRIREVHTCNGYTYCSCKYRTRYGIDYPHVYHVISLQGI